MLDIRRINKLLKPQVLGLISGLTLLLVFIFYTFINSVYFNYTMLIFALIPLSLEVVQIKVKRTIFLIIAKNLFTIIILLYYIFMFIVLSVHNFELKHVVFNIYLILSMLVVFSSGFIEINMYKPKK
jgi:hypothetical protein